MTIKHTQSFGRRIMLLREGHALWAQSKVPTACNPVSSRTKGATVSRPRSAGFTSGRKHWEGLELTAFTLIELLVVIAIIAIIAIGIFILTSRGNRSLS